jgi:hypothetical protein
MKSPAFDQNPNSQLLNSAFTNQHSAFHPPDAYRQKRV